MKKETVRIAAFTSLSAVAGSIASYYIGKWLTEGNILLIVLYSLFMYFVIFLFVKKFE